MAEVQEEHKPITLHVEVNEENKRFVTPKKINGIFWRQAATISDEIETNNVLIADLDGYLQFVCEVFGNQFTIDELENGIDARDILKVVYAICIFVMGQVSVAMEMLNKNIDVGKISEENEKKSSVS